MYRKTRFIQASLRQACEDLSSRGLYLASKWCGELLFGINTGNDEEEGEYRPNDEDSGSENEEYDDENMQIQLQESQRAAAAASIPLREKDQILFAQSLILNGEYLRCAHMLRRQAATKNGNSSSSSSSSSSGDGGGGLSSTLPNVYTSISSPLGRFLATYSMYMAGEKLKEQQLVEKTGLDEKQAELAASSPGNGAAGRVGAIGINGASKSGTGSNPPGSKPQFRNPFLVDLFRDLWPMYYEADHGNSDGNGTRYKDKENASSSSSKPSATGTTSGMESFLLYMLALVVRDLQAEKGGVSAMRQVMTAQHTRVCAIASRRTSAIPAPVPIPVPLPTVWHLLITSIRSYCWNWSCWLDLGAYCVSAQVAPPTWEEMWTTPDTSSRSSGRGTGTDTGAENGQGQGNSNSNSLQESSLWVMYQHFLATFYLEQQNGETAMESINTLAEWFPNSHNVVTFKALALYSLRDYDRAQEAFETARAVDPHQLAHVDTYSNILYVKERRAELSHLAHVVTKIDKFAAETCCVVGNYYSLKGKHERAITYFQRALKSNPKFLPAWTLMGHECVELRNTAAAVQCYRNAVDLSPSDYRAWYGLGQTYEMLHLYQYALYYYKKAASLKPADARMWSAVGSQCVRLSCRMDAMLAFERALQCGDSEGVATRELARLYRDEGRMAEAAQCYIRYLQTSGDHYLISAALETAGDSSSSSSSNDHGHPSLILPTGTSTATGATNVNTYTNFNNNQSVLSVAAAFTIGGTANGMMPLDPEKVEGALFLANYYRSRGELHRSEAFCALLVDFVGPEGEEARAILRDIRSSAVTRLNQRKNTGIGYGKEPQTPADARQGGGLGFDLGVGVGGGIYTHTHDLSPYDDYNNNNGSPNHRRSQHVVASDTTGNSSNSEGEDIAMTGHLSDTSDD